MQNFSGNLENSSLFFSLIFAAFSLENADLRNSAKAFIAHNFQVKSYCHWINLLGAVQDFTNFNIFDELRKSSSSTRAGQLDDFLRRRLHWCPKDMETARSYTSFYFKLLVFEMLYLWNALASCSRENVDLITTGPNLRVLWRLQ